MGGGRLSWLLSRGICCIMVSATPEPSPLLCSVDRLSFTRKIALLIGAAQEVKGVLPEINCDSRKTIVCDLLFSTNGRAIEDKLMVMEAQEVDETIHLLYKILYFDWMASNHHQQLSIVLHCVQKFLVILIDVCPDLETNDRRRLSICSRGLLRQCEEAKYCPLGECLSRTRTLYIQVWCALLCVPFAVE